MYEIARQVFPNRRVGLCTQDEKCGKEEICSNVSPEIDILVSTTVIEVGVRSQRSLMVIEHAERFASHSYISFATRRTAEQAFACS